MRYAPSSPLVTLRVADVSTFVTVTLAFGTTPPLVSLTTPRITPASCADAGRAASTHSSATIPNAAQARTLLNTSVLPTITAPPAGGVAGHHLFDLYPYADCALNCILEILAANGQAAGPRRQTSDQGGRISPDKLA